jgi:hypothetical protein
MDDGCALIYETSVEQTLEKSAQIDLAESKYRIFMRVIQNIFYVIKLNENLLNVTCSSLNFQNYHFLTQFQITLIYLPHLR